MIACGNPAPLFVVPNEAVKADAPILDQFVEMIDVIDVLFTSFGVDITQYCHGLHPVPVFLTKFTFAAANRRPDRLDAGRLP